MLPTPIGVIDALRVLTALRLPDGHRFLADDVSLTDAGVPPIVGHRQVTDAHLLTVARRSGIRLVTFDATVIELAQGKDVELLSVL